MGNFTRKIIAEDTICGKCVFREITIFLGSVPRKFSSPSSIIRMRVCVKQETSSRWPVCSVDYGRHKTENENHQGRVGYLNRFLRQQTHFSHRLADWCNERVGIIPSVLVCLLQPYNRCQFVWLYKILTRKSIEIVAILAICIALKRERNFYFEQIDLLCKGFINVNINNLQQDCSWWIRLDYILRYSMAINSKLLVLSTTKKYIREANCF